MFTGLIKEIGKVKSVQSNREGKVLVIESNYLIKEIGIDDSVSINGVCQTVVDFTDRSFTVQAVHTTLDKTTLGRLSVGEEVNLELALRASDRLGGHFVQGHVGGIAEIVRIKSLGDNYVLSARVPSSLYRYIVLEGSIAIDGISLTIAEVNDEKNEFSVSIIPHTWEKTCLKHKAVGSLVNIETDILGKYIEKLISGAQCNKNHPVLSSSSSNMTEEWIRSKGF